MHQFGIELWPGFDTSIRQYVGDLLLNCDVVHKVMRTDTVYSMLQETRQANPSTWRDDFQRKVLGITVLTGYNNKTYRIDDVDFTKSPMASFPRRDGEITIEKYYAEVRALLPFSCIYGSKDYLNTHSINCNGCSGTTLLYGTRASRC